VLGVNQQELQSSIDAGLTFGILWLDSCRTAHAGKLIVEGLKLFVPAKSSALIRERIARLDQRAAKWELYELDEGDDELKQVEVNDRGNVLTRLVRCPDNEEIFERFGGPIALIRSMMPTAEVGVLSPAEISFRCYGLEFGRARLAASVGNFNGVPEL